MGAALGFGAAFGVAVLMGTFGAGAFAITGFGAVVFTADFGAVLTGVAFAWATGFFAGAGFAFAATGTTAIFSAATSRATGWGSGAALVTESIGFAVGGDFADVSVERPDSSHHNNAMMMTVAIKMIGKFWDTADDIIFSPLALQSRKLMTTKFESSESASLSASPCSLIVKALLSFSLDLTPADVVAAKSAWKIDGSNCPVSGLLRCRDS